MATFGTMDEREFAEVRNRVKRMNTQKDRATLIRAVASNHTFTAKQVCKLVKVGGFSKEKLEILGVLAPRLSSDLKTSLRAILPAFSYDDEKAACKKALETAFEGKT